MHPKAKTENAEEIKDHPSNPESIEESTEGFPETSGQQEEANHEELEDPKPEQTEESYLVKQLRRTP